MIAMMDDALSAITSPLPFLPTFTLCSLLHDDTFPSDHMRLQWAVYFSVEGKEEAAREERTVC